MKNVIDQKSNEEVLALINDFDIETLEKRTEFSDAEASFIEIGLIYTF